MNNSYYREHIFFCVNQRDAERKCCNNANATELRAYAKKRIAELKLDGPNGIRVNTSGCMGRCKEGPVVVIYPEGVWYTYQTKADVDAIVDEHLVAGRIVERLLMKSPEK